MASREYQATLQMTAWDLDLRGRVRRLKRAAVETWLASAAASARSVWRWWRKWPADICNARTQRRGGAAAQHGRKLRRFLCGAAIEW